MFHVALPAATVTFHGTQARLIAYAWGYQLVSHDGRRIEQAADSLPQPWQRFADEVAGGPLLPGEDIAQGFLTSALCILGNRATS